MAIATHRAHTDCFLDTQGSWNDVLPQLKTDPRFTNSQLPLNHKLRLFHAHVDELKAKHLSNLHALFSSHASSLATPFKALPITSILSSLPVTKLGYDVRKLEDVYDHWQRERTQEARLAFDEMLNENAFVEFWGRLGKIGGKGVDEGIKADDIGEDSEEIVDMKALAKTVDLKEMVKVLKASLYSFCIARSRTHSFVQNDKRYLMFDHVPDQRERWLRVSLYRLSFYSSHNVPL